MSVSALCRKRPLSNMSVSAVCRKRPLSNMSVSAVCQKRPLCVTIRFNTLPRIGHSVCPLFQYFAAKWPLCPLFQYFAAKWPLCPLFQYFAAKWPLRPMSQYFAAKRPVCGGAERHRTAAIIIMKTEFDQLRRRKEALLEEEVEVKMSPALLSVRVDCTTSASELCECVELPSPVHTSLLK